MSRSRSVPPRTSLQLSLFVHLDQFQNHGIIFQSFRQVRVSVLCNCDCEIVFFTRNPLRNASIRMGRAVSHAILGPKAVEKPLETDSPQFHSSRFLVQSVSDSVVLNEGFEACLRVAESDLDDLKVSLRFDFVKFDALTDRKTGTLSPAAECKVESSQTVVLQSWEPFFSRYCPVTFCGAFIDYSTVKASVHGIFSGVSHLGGSPNWDASSMQSLYQCFVDDHSDWGDFFQQSLTPLVDAIRHFADHSLSSNDQKLFSGFEDPSVVSFSASSAFQSVPHFALPPPPLPALPPDDADPLSHEEPVEPSYMERGAYRQLLESQRSLFLCVLSARITHFWGVFLRLLLSFPESFYAPLVQDFFVSFRDSWRSFFITERDAFNPDAKSFDVRERHTLCAKAVRTSLADYVYPVPIAIPLYLPDCIAHQTVVFRQLFCESKHSVDAEEEEEGNEEDDPSLEREGGGRTRRSDAQKETKCAKCGSWKFSSFPRCDRCRESDAPRRIDVVVLLHGLQANSWGMKVVRDMMAYYLPNHFFINCRKFENTTEDKIEINMQIRLITSGDPSRVTSLSFVCHSLGGLILRHALPSLGQFHSRLRVLLSLNCPHLGNLFGSRITRTGKFFLKLWKSMTSLRQMDMQDNPNLRETFIYKLSSAPCFALFEKVILVSSPEDRFIPYSSGRVERCDDASAPTETALVYNEMVENLLKGVNPENLMKFDVFYNSDTSLDTVIGRAAHIKSCIDETFLLQFLQIIQPYF